jgi:hypothetical protein
LRGRRQDRVKITDVSGQKKTPSLRRDVAQAALSAAASRAGVSKRGTAFANFGLFELQLGKERRMRSQFDGLHSASRPVPRSTVSRDDTAVQQVGPAAHEETLVPDVRSNERPAEMVESKLSQKLHTPFLGVSQLRHKGVIAPRPGSASFPK